MTDTRRRVKVYTLNVDKQWTDKGTGHVSSSYVDYPKGVSLTVRDESDGSLLLESKIELDTAYKKQQETLIVWNEGEDVDLALSFQEKAGCDEIWEKICEVQRKDPTLNYTQEESEDEGIFSFTLSLPPCELGRLKEISELLDTNCNHPMWREKLALAIETNGYIPKLLNLFHMCEDLENIDGLHQLYGIFKAIFLLNKGSLLEVMFKEDTIFDVMGCLEYDPCVPVPNKHRLYLQQLTKFKEVIPITNPKLVTKIHTTYRAQYIYDVMFSLLSQHEDNHVSALLSFIMDNKMEIATEILQDKTFLSEVFAQLRDEATDCLKCRDLILFLQEFYELTTNLFLIKDLLYKTLFSLGIIPALETALVTNDAQMKHAAIVIFTRIVEYSPSYVHDYVLQQINKTDQDQVLINVLINQTITNSVCGSPVYFVDILRMLLDPENMATEQEDFLNYFYKYSVHVLASPLLANTLDDYPAKDDEQQAHLQSHILELLSFCVEKHKFHMKNYIITKNLLRHALVLIKSMHTFLVLCALRFMKKIISLKDEVYNRYIIKGSLFGPVIDVFIKNKGRYNLLDSAIVEMFEFIKLEGIKSLCSHIMKKYGKLLYDIHYVQTFKELKRLYDQHQENSKDIIPLDSVSQSRYQRQMEEAEEEMWLNEEQEDHKELVMPAANNISKKLHSKQDYCNPNAEDNSNAGDNTEGLSSLSPLARYVKSETLKKALVDYEGDTDDEDEGGDVLPPAFKRTRN